MTYKNDPLTIIVVGGSDLNVNVGQFYLTINIIQKKEAEQAQAKMNEIYRFGLDIE